jgi:hypothetical protein
MAWKASESQIRQVPYNGFFSNCFGLFTDAVLTGKPSVAVGGSLGGFRAVGFRFRCVTQGFAN